MTKEDLSITYENNIFYCTKNNTKWISVDGEKWYGDEKRITELEAVNKRISDECHKLVGSLEKKQNEIAELIGKVAFLENDLNNAKAQIEKMKCCENCNNFMHRIDHRCNTKCKNLSEWEIKEK